MICLIGKYKQKTTNLNFLRKNNLLFLIIFTDCKKNPRKILRGFAGVLTNEERNYILNLSETPSFNEKILLLTPGKL